MHWRRRSPPRNRGAAAENGEESVGESNRQSRNPDDDRVRACYQHCALKWVGLQPMTNQSLRSRFHLAEDKAAIASQVIAATIDAKLIKPDESVRGSRKFARYQPFWA